jgi:hypothetical protein
MSISFPESINSIRPQIPLLSFVSIGHTAVFLHTVHSLTGTNTSRMQPHHSPRSTQLLTSSEQQLP